MKDKLQVLLDKAQAAKTFNEAQAARAEIAQTIDPNCGDFDSDERDALIALIESVK